MKKMMIPFLSVLALSVTSAHADIPRSRDDLALKITLENQFNTKLEKTYPNARFVVTVNMTEPRNIKLDLIGGSAAVRNQDKAVIDQIDNVAIFSEENFAADKLAAVMEIPAQKVHVKQLEHYEKAKPVVQAEVKPQTFGEKLRSGMENYYQALVAFGVLAGAGVAVFLMLGLFRIAAGIQTVAKNLFQSGNARGETEVAPRAAQAATQTTGESLSSNGRKWTPAQLQAIFAECYWTEQDQTASALVRNHPTPAYTELRFGKDYMTYLMQVNAGNLEVLNDAYFMNPNPIFMEMSPHDTPAGLVSQCSKIRFEKLGITAAEMIRAQNRPASGFQTAVTSALRTLPMVYRVKFKDVEEETTVLASNEFTDAVKLALPSLFALERLDQASFDEVVQSVSVTELAEAWVGPAELLTQIEARLPTRKREVFNQVKRSVTPSRDSAGFHKIMAACKTIHQQAYVVSDDFGDQAA